MTATDPAADAPRRVSIQVWGNDVDGYTGYCPQTDTHATASTFDGARTAAIDAALTLKEEAPMKIPAERWTCNNGHQNPDGRTDCAACGTPLL